MNQEPKPAYRPLGVEDINNWSPSLGTHRVKRVHLMFSDGQKSYVDVLEANYGKDTVEQAAMQAAQHHQDVMAIEGPPTYPGQPVQPNPWSGGSS